MKQIVDWHQHWTRAKPGFHEGRVNDYLQTYLADYHLQSGDRIFVPLCGKAHDLHWLAQQGYDVVGVELSRVAVESFFTEHALDYEASRDREFIVYRSENITLYQGDFMHLETTDVGPCRLIYDRAAIVAIEHFNRAIYSERLVHLVPQRTPMLMITLEYDQSVMSGPPFSVPVEEIAQHFRLSHRIERLQTNEQIDERPKWREKGLKSFRETALRLTPI